MLNQAAVLLVFGCVVSSAQIKSDVEFWSELDLTKKLTDSIAVTVLGVDRSSIQLANPQLAGVGAVFDFRSNNLLTLSLGYIHAGLPNTGKGLTVDVPLVAASLGRTFGHWSIRERSRGELLYGVTRNPYRYREKVDVSYSLAPRLQVFANDEVFYQFGINRWNQNRAQVGLQQVLNQALSVDLFYLQRNTSSEPKNTRGVGLTVHLTIGPTSRRKRTSKAADMASDGQTEP